MAKILGQTIVSSVLNGFLFGSEYPYLPHATPLLAAGTIGTVMLMRHFFLFGLPSVENTYTLYVRSVDAVGITTYCRAYIHEQAAQ